MRISRLLLWAPLCSLGAAAGLLSARPNVNVEHAQVCTVVTAQEISRARQPSVADALQATPGTPCSQPPLNAFDQRILDIHNRERALVGAAPLRWNPTLAQHAAAFAQQLATTGQLVHAPREGRQIERENLQKGLLGWDADRMVLGWRRERANFIPGNFPNVARDGNWINVAHYTQMIWPTTTDIGCGQADGLGFSWFVCRYSPGGNKDGKPVGTPVQIASTPPPRPGVARGGNEKLLIDQVAEAGASPQKTRPETAPAPPDLVKDVTSDALPMDVGTSELLYDASFNVNLTGGVANMFHDLFLITDQTNFNIDLNQLSGSAFANYLNWFPALSVHEIDLTHEFDQCIPAKAETKIDQPEITPKSATGPYTPPTIDLSGDISPTPNDCVM